MKLTNFPPIDFSVWRKKVLDELDGKPIKGPMQELGLSSPIELDRKLFKKQDWHKWLSEESFVIGDVNLEKVHINESLENGIQSLNFVFEKSISYPEFEYLFDGIILDIIPLNFNFNNKEIANEILQHYLSYCKNNIQDISVLQGRIFVKQSQAFNKDFQSLKNYGFEIEGQNAEEKLVSLFHEIVPFIKDGISPSQFFVKYHLVEDFYENIVLIYALRHLWQHVLKKYDLAFSPIFIAAINSQIQEENTTLIASNVKALSAVVAGVNSLDIKPLNTDDPVFNRRISRNIHNILNYESKFETINNPGSGSYLLENQSIDLGNKVLQKLNL